jgi:prevent-host-death family protein
MISLTITEIGTQLQETLERAEAGEKVILTRAGKPVLQITPIRKTLPFAELAEFRARQALSTQPSLEDLQAIRRETRYF